MTLPTYGLDLLANADDTYALVIAARTGEEKYDHIRITCATQDAIVSMDAGVTGNYYCKAGETIEDDFPPRQGAVHAKNGVVGSDYANLVIHIGTVH
jgi:hypothetical protein